ncbi:MAG: thioredoxin domain-containing protein, partial [Actinobacteria bacterium]|nr:thioredoxin domain-containing protein [Actinomycetota bacterium]
MDRVNRLGVATSPYLLQHKDNPVDWWEWSDEAFAEAKRRDVPVLLSVGYAACHWCHVMAHDSFEDEEVASVMNDHFVSIKVDREERPDVDAVYMDAVTAMTGQGGWPMTCVLTPDREPFYAGTFFPREQFRRLLLAISQTWQERRGDVEEAGRRVVSALGQAAGLASTEPLDAAALDRAAAALVEGFDPVRGGFGGAPKFPPSMALEFLLRHVERTGSSAAGAAITRTADAMARGGMYDQLAGGFARYSVDADWVVPHFEKMLYDNALLLSFYLHWWRLSGDPLGERIARETAEFLLADLRTSEGGFASALDADTEGVEGLTYVWTPTQLADVLGPEDGRWAAALLTVTSAGTFEHGSSTLQLRRDPDDPARWHDVRERLLAARQKRAQPARDDKLVTSWNGLAIAGLAEAAVLLDEQRYLDAATDCARLLLDRHVVDGRLRRTSRGGVVGAAAGVADDYGNLAAGLLMLHQASADPHWLNSANELLDTADQRFSAQDGGFFDTADDAETLVVRPRDPTDNASPSGTAALIAALVTSSSLTGSLARRRRAEQALAAMSSLAQRHPRFAGWSLATAEALLDGPVEIAVVGSGPLGPIAWRGRPPGAVVVVGAPAA